MSSENLEVEDDSWTYWDNLLIEEFNKETDRAAVILVVALFDSALESLLRNYLVPSPSGRDEVFNGLNAPLSAFSSKINLSFRLGLISHQFCRDLHIIRKIRNDFAHDIHNCSFENSRVKSRVGELVVSSCIIKQSPEIRKGFPEGNRGDFLMLASWMLYFINRSAQKLSPLRSAELEFGYCPDSIEDIPPKVQAPEEL
ncbi:MAG: hypothetical protein JW727_04225 [Candidatus Aenigmarchaeota archaeon]|nr:hypothetical protein [Candidatus Aenigmarchaeota archaeon]